MPATSSPHLEEAERSAGADGGGPIPILLDSRPGPPRRSTNGKGKERALEDGEDEGVGREEVGRTFWRRAKWSPDGSHVLLQGEEHSLQTMHLRPVAAPESNELNPLASAAYNAKLDDGQMPLYLAPGPLLDVAWYPYATAPLADGDAGPSTSAQVAPADTLVMDPSKDEGDVAAAQAEDKAQAREQSWCFLASVRNVPVRLVDAASGKTRTSYGLMDHIERFPAPTALAFSPYGDRFYSGHDSLLTTHDLLSPGLNTHTCHMALAGAAANRGTDGRPTRTPRKASRKAAALVGMSRRARLRLTRTYRRRLGASLQRGVVSSLAVSLDYGFHGGSTEGEHATAGSEGGAGARRLAELVAVGTFAGNVGLYALGRGESAGECCVAGWKEDRGTGISQLAFHPTAPHLLFVKMRRTSEIKVYDIRLLCGCLAVDFTSRAQATFGEGRTSGTLVAVLRPSFASSISTGTDTDASEKKTSSKRARQGPRRTKAKTQQRLFLDVHPSGRWLCAGDAGGTVHIWDVSLDPQKEPSTTTTTRKRRSLRSLLEAYEHRLMHEPQLDGHGDAQNADEGEMELRPVYAWRAHREPVACTTFHPTLPLVLTLGGTRPSDEDEDQDEHAGEQELDDDESGQSEGESTDGEGTLPRDGGVDGDAAASAPSAATLLRPNQADPALKLWYLPLLLLPPPAPPQNDT